MVKLKAAYESRQIRIRSTYRFSELNRTQFKNLVRKYDGNRYVKQFTCCNQLLAMMFGQLSNRESLRDIIAAFEVNRAKQYHLVLDEILLPKPLSLILLRIEITESSKTSHSIQRRKLVKSGQPTF